MNVDFSSRPHEHHVILQYFKTSTNFGYSQFIGYGTGRFGHPEQDRAITLREGAILQSFPPDYQFSPSNVEVPIRKIARHIGNAVPPRLGEVIGESIIRSLPKKRQKKATIANERERIQT